ncbi:MAG: prepilin-type N-terminal cleavage/methylation domain-containing protein [Candidatus Omnitrophica bacterium]|nr:prepilin-type N-terminal cleavage/methylation domain-containing protein [Candidatus Omnitrophota bacterium]
MFKKSGFTLIELLIVIAIILILIAIALPNFLDAQARAKVVKSEGDMKSMTLAIESYFLDWKDYFRSWQINKMTTPIAYMSTLPEDPFGPIKDSDYGYGSVLNAYGSPIKKFYIYHGPDVYDPNPLMQRIGVRWVLTGLGPDGGWFDSPGGASKYPRYNPTNGSRSRGNLEVVGPGQIPQDKYRLFWD